MQTKTTYYSEVKSGKLQPSITKRILSDLKPYEGKRVEITLQKLKSKRSDKQNRIYWAYITILANELGYTEDKMHSLVGRKFLKEPIVIGNDTEFVIKSTAKLNKTEFADFTSELQQWAAQSLNIHLPDPNSQVLM